MADRVRGLLDRREPFYAQAMLVVDADGSPDAVAHRVAEALQGWEEADRPG